MNNKYIIACLLLIILSTTACRKKYYNCECTYINEYDEADTMLLSVRATNSKKAKGECADAEIKVAIEEGFALFCKLQ